MFRRTVFCVVLGACAITATACSGRVTPTTAPTTAKPSATVAATALAATVPATSAPTLAAPTSVSAPSTPTRAEGSPAAPTLAAPTSTATRSSAAANYDGEWEGKSSTNSIINFIVDKNQITNASLNYSDPKDRPSGCPVSGSSVYAGTVKTPIVGNTFTLNAEGGSKTPLTFIGRFSSATNVSGTLRIQGTFDFCDKPYDSTVTWTATKK